MYERVDSLLSSFPHVPPPPLTPSHPPLQQIGELQHTSAKLTHELTSAKFERKQLESSLGKEQSASTRLEEENTALLQKVPY